MRKTILIAALFALLTTFGATDAMAIGLGLGGQSGSGTMAMELDGTSQGDYDFETSDVGLVLDTNLSRDRAFNYRLTLASASASMENSSFDDLTGFTLVNDFGFGIVKTEAFRLWMGPELRFSWLSQTIASGAELDLFSFGIGPVIGANINIGSTVTLAITGAYLFQTTNGDYWDAAGWWYDFSSDEEMLTIGANLIFRINEDFYD